MSDEDDIQASGTDELEKIASKFIGLLERAKDNLPLTGTILIGAGTAIKTFFPTYDFVIFDFGGNHVAPPSAAKAAQASAQTGQPMPAWVKAAQEYLQIIWDFGSIVPGGSILEQVPAVKSDVQAAGVNTSQNIFTLLGINLPTKITISEVLILGGILCLADPLLKSLAGSASSLLSKVPISLG